MEVICGQNRGIRGDAEVVPAYDYRRLRESQRRCIRREAGAGGSGVVGPRGREEMK
ncbi:MAG: hypothetical protein U9R79_09050 [Armatimonadota bacterium]|nr:hypothetical protein [Armatimonadota bacterium]